MLRHIWMLWVILLLVFFKNYTVKCLDNEDSDSQGHSVYISNEKNELTYEGTLFISVGKWETVHVLRHIWMLWVILLLVFSKTIQ